MTYQRYGWWKESCTSWYGKYPIISWVLYIPGGFLAGFLNRQQYGWKRCLSFYGTFDADSGAVPGGSGVIFHQQVPGSWIKHLKDFGFVCLFKAPKGCLGYIGELYETTIRIPIKHPVSTVWLPWGAIGWSPGMSRTKWFLYFLPRWVTNKPPFGDFFPSILSKFKFSDRTPFQDTYLWKLLGKHLWTMAC